MVSPPVHVSVCPSPALELGWFGHRSVAPPAAPVCWALLGSLLRRSVALASGHTFSLCFSRLGFLPLEFVWTWVGRLRSCLGSCLLLGELSFPCPGFRLAVPAVWLSLLLQFSWNLCLGSFLSLSVFAVSMGWLRMVIGCSSLRSLAAEVVTLVLSQVLVGLPLWGCSASGFLVPAVFLVFTMGSPVSGRDCVLPQSAIVTKAFPGSGGFDSWPSCGVPCLWLTMCASACVGPGGCPSFSRVGPAPTHWVPFLWTWLVWEASTVFLLLCIPLGRVTLWGQ